VALTLLVPTVGKRLESNLPVERPLAEPDNALYLPARYLILIEAKFTGPNPFYTDGPRRDAHSLTKEEPLNIYYFYCFPYNLSWFFSGGMILRERW
jgi:hypothetical protein